jgi:mono/diheme cytochrome c family protein
MRRAARLREDGGMSDSASEQKAGRPWRRWILRGTVGLIALLALIQVVPYGRSHTNPATTREPTWDSQQTRRLFMSACGDCHSNTTRWPWYSNVAPVSWLTQRDVDSGRSQFDVSNWDRPQDVGAGDMAETIRNGSMPPWFYKPLHAGSSLSSADRDRLIAGLARTLSASPPIGGGG